ncbi:MAG: GNAT family N-acetyltransferase, partial [Endomicrobiales bacterium]
MEIQEITTFDRFLALEPVWNGLLERSDADVPFLTFEWMSSWWKSFGSGNELFILVAKDGGETVAIAPLMRTKTTWRGLPVRAVSFMANEHSFRAGLILGRDDPRITENIFRYIKGSPRRYDIMKLELMVRDSSTFTTVRRVLLKDSMPHVDLRSELSPYIPVSGTWDDFVKSRSRNFRSKMKLAANRLKRGGEYEVAAYTSGDLTAVMEELLAVSRRTWKFKAGTAIASRPESAGFYRELAAAAASKGWLNLRVLRVKGLPVAFLFNLDYKGRSFFLKTGFDEGYRELSSGEFLGNQAIKECFDRGFREYDLLG